MKILSIGNSFSQDAQRWLHDIAVCGGDVIDTYDLIIGGCTLETHCERIADKKAEYGFEGNGGEQLGRVSANEIVENGKYDVVTIQQASGFSGIPQSYIPYVTELAGYLRKHQPGAELLFHMTWSYEIDSDHGHFPFYNKDQNEMFRRINDCAEMVKRLTGAGIIPAGAFIQYLRENTAEFNYREGGASLCRDGFHLSETYGRFSAAAVWYKTLTGKYPDAAKFAAFHPEFDPALLRVIVEKLRESRI